MPPSLIPFAIVGGILFAYWLFRSGEVYGYDQGYEDGLRRGFRQGKAADNPLHRRHE